MKISKETKKAIGWMLEGASILALIFLAATVDYATKEVMEIGPVHREAMKNIVSMVSCSTLMMMIVIGWIVGLLYHYRSNLITMNREIEDLKLGLDEALCRIRELELFGPIGDDDHAEKVEKQEDH